MMYKNCVDKYGGVFPGGGGSLCENSAGEFTTRGFDEGEFSAGEFYEGEFS